MDSVEILDHFNQARAYPFDALSHYLNESLLHPQEHIQSYQRGHCLDLAVSLCCALGQGAEIVGNIKPGWLIPTHYAVYYREPTTHWWLDPSVGVAIPLKVGTAFDLNGKRNVLTGVWSDHFELVVEGGRTICLTFEPIQPDNLMQQQIQIHHTRKNLTLRRGEHHLRYLWQEQQFQWGERLFLPWDLGRFDRQYLQAAFGFDVGSLLMEFWERYHCIPDSHWQWEL